MVKHLWLFFKSRQFSIIFWLWWTVKVGRIYKRNDCTLINACTKTKTITTSVSIKEGNWISQIFKKIWLCSIEFAMLLSLCLDGNIGQISYCGFALKWSYWRLVRIHLQFCLMSFRVGVFFFERLVFFALHLDKI